MKILITGARGMVGLNITEYLKKNTSFNILTPSKNELNLLNEYQIETYLKKEKPDLIIHAAGVVGGIQANINNPVKFLVENSLIGINLIRISYKLGIKRLLNIASSCMYPKFASNPLKEDYILDGKLEPTNEGYAIAKITSTRLCEYINRENKEFQYKTIIPCNLYGRYDKFDSKYSHMIPAVIKKIHDAKENNLTEIDIWGNGEARREFMYVEDLADFVLYDILNFEKMPQNLNIGMGIDYSINEYYQLIAEIIGYKGKFINDLTKPVGMQQKLVDITKLKEFGWKYKISLKDGIRKTYDYFLHKVVK